MDGFRLDFRYDRDNADPGTGSRYGNYLRHRARQFAEIDDDDPTVPVAVLAWRIANGPVLAPPLVVAPPAIIYATLERDDWDGQAILDVEWRIANPLRVARTADGIYYRDWRTDYSGRFEGFGGEDLARGPYLLARQQLLLRLPVGTFPALTTIPTGDALRRHAVDCVQGLVDILNREVVPLLSGAYG